MTRAFVIGIVTAVLQASVADAGALTLDEALARARSANSDLAVAAADIAAARGRFAQAGVLAANPVLTTAGTHHRIPGEVNADAAVRLGQELAVGGQRGLRIAAARHDVAHAEWLRADRERLVDGEVRRAFVGVVAAERRRALAVDAAAQSERLADIAGTRLAHGDTGRLDVDLARLDATKTHADAAAAQIAVDAARTRLATAIGAEPDEILAVAAPDEPTRPTPTEDAVLARAITARPDLTAARAERDRLEGEANLAHRVGLIPNPTIRGFYSHENGSETLVGAEIEVPLPIFDRQQGAEMELRGQAAAAAAQVTRLERDIPREIRAALAHHRAAQTVWSRYREAALPAADQARASLTQALSAGLVGIADVLAQQDRLREARGASVDAWLDLHEAEADVIEALGEGPW